MKRVLSVSLGSSKRDKRVEVEWAGEPFVIERVGTDGSYDRLEQLLRENDGKADAFGLGGADFGLWVRGRRYLFRSLKPFLKAAVRTPIVDGSGVRNTLERECVRFLHEEGLVDFKRARSLLTLAVTRFGIAEEIVKLGGEMMLGDVMFDLQFPLPIRSWRFHQALAAALVPLIVQLPYRWLYPTGEKQEQITPRWGKWYAWADLIAGDFHTIRRYMPPDLTGKVILTNTTTEEDVAELRKRGVSLLVTTWPALEGRTFGTNVIDAAIVTLAGKRPEEMQPRAYLDVARDLGWRPGVQRLRG
jgi:hypothetical protein